jgi:hypothetical protein
VKTVLPADFGRAANALCEAFPSVRRLESLLMSRLNRDFDYLTSRSLSLYDNALDITKKASAGGWANDLFEAARAEQPDNPVLRQFWESMPDAADAAAAAPPPADDKRPSLVCGRADQWNEVSQCAPANQHQILIVMGEVGQATNHFCERVQTYLSNDPRRSVVAVDWPPKRPASKDAFFEPLAKALQTDVTTLPQTIASRLTNENLVLLHDCVKVRFRDDALVSYYTTWLPELLAGTTNGPRVKCVQPIEWPASPRSILRLFSSGSSDDASEARNLIGLLRSGQAAYMPLVELDELKDVTDGEIRSFVKTSELTPAQKERLLAELLSPHRVPETLFETIDACWNSVQAAP